MNEETTMIKVKVSTRDFLKILAPSIGMTMQETAEVAFYELAKQRAGWLVTAGHPASQGNVKLQEEVGE